MSIFSKKVRVNIDSFTKSYYDRYLPFEEPNLEFFRILKNQIAYVDKSFASYDFDQFLNQMAAIKLECFGLAWFYRFGDKHTVDNCVVTKKYLQEHTLLNIWEDLGSYNSEAAKSATYGANESTMTGRGRISLINNMRVELFRKFVSEGFDHVCVARAINRFGTRIEISIDNLIANLAIKLNYEFNEEAKHILISRISSFYLECKQDFKKIKILN